MVPDSDDVPKPGVPTFAEDSRGLLGLHPFPPGLVARRYPPSAPLSALVDRIWVVTWDRTGEQPLVQHTITGPAVQLVHEQGRAIVFGVPRGRLTRERGGAGRTLGVRFRPGGFRALHGSSVAPLTDRVLPATEVLGPSAAVLDRALSPEETPDEADAVAYADAWFRQLAGPAVHEHPLTPVAERIEADPSIVRVGQVAALAGLSPRPLPRRFSDAVGVGPTWVIKRFRLLEAADRARAGRQDWAGVAAELGYSDQAHLVRDFTRVIGVGPARYAREGVAAVPSRLSGPAGRPRTGRTS